SLGAAGYLAPAQNAGGDATPASDLDSVGAVFYALLAGRPSYRVESIAELAAQQAEGVIRPVRDLEPKVPPEVEAAVMHALAREPRFRPASAADLGRELVAAAERPTRTLPPQQQRRRFVSLPGRGGWLWLA